MIMRKKWHSQNRDCFPLFRGNRP